MGYPDDLFQQTHMEGLERFNGWKIDPFTKRPTGNCALVDENWIIDLGVGGHKSTLGKINLNCLG